MLPALRRNSVGFRAFRVHGPPNVRMFRGGPCAAPAQPRDLGSAIGPGVTCAFGVRRAPRPGGRAADRASVRRGSPGSPGSPASGRATVMTTVTTTVMGAVAATAAVTVTGTVTVAVAAVTAVTARRGARGRGRTGPRRRRLPRRSNRAGRRPACRRDTRFGEEACGCERRPAECFGTPPRPASPGALPHASGPPKAAGLRHRTDQTGLRKSATLGTNGPSNQRAPSKKEQLPPLRIELRIFCLKHWAMLYKTDALPLGHSGYSTELKATTARGYECGVGPCSVARSSCLPPVARLLAMQNPVGGCRRCGAPCTHALLY